MSGGLNIRRFQDGDEERVNELLSAVFSNWKGIDYWRRKYLKDPTGVRRNIWVAEDGNKIVGYYAIIPVNIKTDAGVVLGAQSVDTVTHPDYRRQQLFERLLRKTLEDAVSGGIKVVYGFPGQKSYAGFIKTGFSDMGIPRHYRILDLKKAFRWHKPWPKQVGVLLSTFCNTVMCLWMLVFKRDSSSQVSSGLRPACRVALLLAIIASNLQTFRPIKKMMDNAGRRIYRVHRFDAGITDLWREISPRYPNSVDRNAEYLNWRYTRNAGDDYVILVAENNGKVGGYMVLKSEPELGIIMDIVARDNDTFSDLIDSALQRFKEESKSVLEIWMTGMASFDRVLNKMGFGSYRRIEEMLHKFKRTRGFVVRFILSSDGVPGFQSRMDNSCPWFVSVGDTDWEDISGSELV
jgi:predicted N-acetyltransferase YhbS